MAIPKYSRPEFERRFLVAENHLPALSGNAYWTIHDTYFPNGRLRLRKIEETGTGSVVYKLCKKYEHPDLHGGPIVNMYLAKPEYTMLRTLDGYPITKRRYHDNVHGVRWAIDVFMGELEGLAMCETEASSTAVLATLPLPDYAGIEVTEHSFFRGGELCKALRQDLERELGRLGLRRS